MVVNSSSALDTEGREKGIYLKTLIQDRTAAWAGYNEEGAGS
jgi:hypothetical protein